MKAKVIAIGSLLLLTTLFAAALLTMQTAASVTADVRITPFMLSEEDPAPADFRVTVKLPESSGYTPADINPETVTLEGIPMLTNDPDYPQVKRRFFAFKVDGMTLYNVVWSKAAHMGALPGQKVNVDLTVTGNFFDGNSFAGTDTIVFMTLHASPPPPPTI